jgi:hypothetical protein
MAGRGNGDLEIRRAIWAKDRMCEAPASITENPELGKFKPY